LPSGANSPRREPMSTGEFRTSTKILKVDEELGLVFGWAIVSKIESEPYFDLQGDHIPEDAMLSAATDFMANSRVASEMHKGRVAKVEERGSVVFAFPMTTEIAVAFGIVTKQTGLMIAMKPDAEMFDKFKNGTLTGFSIGGKRGEDEEID